MSEHQHASSPVDAGPSDDVAEQTAPADMRHIGDAASAEVCQARQSQPSASAAQSQSPLSESIGADAGYREVPTALRREDAPSPTESEQA